MKTFLKSTSLLVATVLGLVACNNENLTPEGEGTIGRSDIVRFGAQAQLEAGTKATLTTEDEAMFKSAWEGGDGIGIEYSSEKGSGTVEALWKGSAFETQIAGEKGEWSYSAVYPAPSGETRSTPFGTNRYQKGNSYNSQYDLMKGSAKADGAAPGKTSDEKDIVFNMDRQTGIVYFHLKTTSPEVKGEKVIAATLSVEGGDIACDDKNTPLWGDVAYNRDAPYFVVAPKIAENTYKATMSMSTSNKDRQVLLEFYSDLNWGQNGIKPVKITGSAASRFSLNEAEGWFCGVDEKEDPFVKGNYQLIITSSTDGISIDVTKVD